MSILKEFREFAIKGNVMDLAVAVIIGAAFGKIISSMVDNILMPIIGIFLHGVNFQKFSIRIGDAEIKYGMFISAVLDFLIIATVLFLAIRIMNRMKKKDTTAAPEPALSKDQELLAEIRDLLKNR